MVWRLKRLLYKIAAWWLAFKRNWKDLIGLNPGGGRKKSTIKWIKALRTN